MSWPKTVKLASAKTQARIKKIRLILLHALPFSLTFKLCEKPCEPATGNPATLSGKLYPANSIPLKPQGLTFIPESSFGPIYFPKMGKWLAAAMKNSIGTDNQVFILEARNALLTSFAFSAGTALPFSAASYPHAIILF